MLSDIIIARNSEMLKIDEVARKINISTDDIEMYGKYKAKVNEVVGNKNGKLILVTAISPTPAGEGKSTTSIGLVDGLNLLGHNAIGCLREPSMGPVFGLKGGAAGGGYSQVVPMEDINLHFTGDIHAITSANNLISAMMDNHIHQGNSLNIDINNIVFKRVIDCNDRSLREITIAQGSHINGVERKDGFQITVASEIMAILCLASDLENLKERISKIIVGFNLNGEIVTVNDLGITDAVAIVLKDAIKPNLVQTLENNPVFIHGGPFANIAHGCNSLIATKQALTFGDYVVTEAGFGADLGSEKFIDIKCRMGNIKPDAIVIVATLRAIKYHGGCSDLVVEDIEAIKKGFCNLEKHIETIKEYGIDFVVSINQFDTDTELEINTLKVLCEEKGYKITLSTNFIDGGKGCVDLSKEVVSICQTSSELNFIYNDDDDSFSEKLNKIITKVYGGNTFVLSDEATKNLELIKSLNLEHLPVCIAKTPASLSEDPKLIGRPSGFDLNIKKITISNGAGFLVVHVGNVMIMPGLPKVPAANNMHITDGIIEGLF